MNNRIKMYQGARLNGNMIYW